MIAQQAVGVPTTVVAAATIAVAQVCRAIAAATYYDRVDLSLSDPKRGAGHQHVLARTGILPAVETRRGG
jgi:hypothetical protein